ncbi:MAG: saccharopine dehydrogenase family protein [Candidatus Bathyarchaeia archaeon]
MRVLILGCGNIGFVAAEDIAKSMSNIDLVLADKSEGRAKGAAERIGGNVSWIRLDATNIGQLVEALRNVDLAMGFLPGKLGYNLMKICIAEGANLVDVSYAPENPLTLNEEAAKASVIIVPDCGFAPGISNMLVGHAVTKLNRVQSIHIMAGGLPERPIPPLGYVITWSPENLIDLYMRKARIVKEGKIVEVDALSGLEEVEFPVLGKLEAFYTDGLRNLPQTIYGVSEMWEKTLRYPGHAEKIRLLKSLGFFEETPLNIDEAKVSPLKLTIKLFEQKLWKPEIKDVAVLRVEVSGVENGRQITYIYHLLDRYDEKSGITAMGRTTAYPASIIAQLILKKVIKEKGVIPPERIGMNNELFLLVLKELEKRKIKITEERIA